MYDLGPDRITLGDITSFDEEEGMGITFLDGGELVATRGTPLMVRLEKLQHDDPVDGSITRPHQDSSTTTSKCQSWCSRLSSKDTMTGVWDRHASGIQYKYF